MFCVSVCIHCVHSLSNPSNPEALQGCQSRGGGGSEQMCVKKRQVRSVSSKMNAVATGQRCQRRSEKKRKEEPETFCGLAEPRAGRQRSITIFRCPASPRGFPRLL